MFERHNTPISGKIDGAQGQHSTTCVMPQPFCLWFGFYVGSCAFTLEGLRHDPFYPASQVAVIMSICYNQEDYHQSSSPFFPLSTEYRISAGFSKVCQSG
jgi:hypothetical protein